MLDPFEASIRWKKVKGYLDKMTDPVLKSSVLEVYKQRAESEWGYCPDGKPTKPQTIKLNDYDKDLLSRIKSGKEYGIFIKNESVEKEFKIRMKDFITKGGKFSDLPKELQNEHILKGYLDVIYSEIDACEKILFN